MTAPVENNTCDLFYVAALPKSASSFVWLVASALQEPNGRANAARLPKTMPSPFESLPDEILKMFPHGGVYKSHAPCSAQTRAVLKRFECKYAILLRHPADFIAALYCHLIGEHQRLSDLGDAGEWIEMHKPVSRAAVDYPKSSVEDGISHLIEDGSLLDALQWTNAWLTLRDPARSIVVTYKSLQANLEEFVNRLSYLIRDEPASADRLAYITSIHVDTAVDRTVRDNKYPRGWTGKVGVWRDYFSAKHRDIYNKTVRSFQDTLPSNCSISEIYPELLI